MEKTKIYPLPLSEEHRSRLGILAAENRVKISDLVRGWLEEKWSARGGGGNTGVGVRKVPAVERKPAKVESEVISGPVSSIAGRVCAECNLVSESWVYDKKGKPICPECAERLAGSNP